MLCSSNFYERLKILFHNEWCRVKPYDPCHPNLRFRQNTTRLVGELKAKGIYVLYIYKRQRDILFQHLTLTLNQFSKKFVIIKLSHFILKEFGLIRVKVGSKDSIEFSGQSWTRKLFELDSEISVFCCIYEAHESPERYRRQIRNIRWHGFSLVQWND